MDVLSVKVTFWVMRNISTIVNAVTCYFKGSIKKSLPWSKITNLTILDDGNVVFCDQNGD